MAAPNHPSHDPVSQNNHSPAPAPPSSSSNPPESTSAIPSHSAPEAAKSLASTTPQAQNASLSATSNPDNIIQPIPDTPATPGTPSTASSTQSVVRISLLLTTGTRHPMSITRNFLKKRNVNLEDGDPYNITVYQLKQLIWNDWRSEWQDRPSSPTYIRLIFFGSLLNDTTPLKDCRLSRSEFNVVHMTVRPQEILEEEDTAKDAKKDGSTRSGGCCIIL